MVATLETPEKTDEQLAAEAAREGSDGPAFVTLMGRHRDRVWRVCYRLMGNEHDAGDAAQEVFVRMFLARASFAGRSKYTTWVHGMAVRTCLSLRRSRGRRLRHETTVGEEAFARHEPQQKTTDPGLTPDLTHMLETLDEEDRALLILKYAESYSYEELADIFDLSTSACKMRVSRAKEKLQSRYGTGD